MFGTVMVKTFSDINVKQIFNVKNTGFFTYQDYFDKNVIFKNMKM